MMKKVAQFAEVVNQVSYGRGYNFMRLNDGSVQEFFCCLNLIQIDQILGILWYFVPYVALGSERVELLESFLSTNVRGI